MDAAKYGVGSPLRGTIVDAGRYLSTRWIQAVASVASVVILSRLMAPGEYGTYVLLLAWSALVSTCVFNWVTAAAFRFYEEARRAGDASGLYQELTYYYLMMVGIWGVVSGVVLGFVVKGALNVSIAGVGFLALLGLVDPIVTMYQNIKMAARDVRSAAIVGISDSLLRCMLGIGGAAVFTDRIGGVLAGQFVAAGIIVSVLILRMRSRVFFRRGQVNWGRVWSLMSYGYPMAGMTIFSWVLSVSDRILLSWMLGASAVGVYSAGYQLGSNAILFPSSSVMAGAFPVVIRQYEGRDEIAAGKLLTTLLTGVLIGGFALVIFLGIASQGIVRMLLGEAYLSAATVMPVVAAGQLLAALSDYFAKGFQLTRRTAVLFVVTLIAACVNVLANLALVPWAGITGAAAATVLAYAVSLGMTASLGRKLLAVRLPLGSLWRVALAAATTWAVQFWLWPGEGTPVPIAGLLGLGGVVLFAAMLWATGEPGMVAVAKRILGSRRAERG